MTREEIKRLLKRGRTIDREIKIIDNEYKSTALLIEKAKDSGIKSALEYSALVEEYRNELYTIRCQIFRLINIVDDVKLRILLELRYISCWTWGEIADEMYYSLSTVNRLHGEAIKNIEKNLRKTDIL